jgi:acetoin utilization deacetylase AcuC-like enzyme
MALYLSHPAMLAHDPRERLPGHPETPQRMLAIEAALDECDWLGWETRLAPLAEETWLELVHTPAHVEAMRSLCAGGGGIVDLDTAVGRQSWPAALHAAGGACELVRSLLAGEHRVGLAAGRPPGHHAEPERAMGFCLFGNLAVAAALAIDELGAERVLVVDWDVHHGNGTEACFRDRADVLFVSLHQSPLWPGSGAASDRGSGAGEGYTVNLPVPPGSGEETWLPLIEERVLPIGLEFEPDLILVSAGFDAHRADPLAQCLLESSSFATMATRLADLAERAGAPLGLVLEGGYHVPSLVESLLATMEALGE